MKRHIKFALLMAMIIVSMMLMGCVDVDIDGVITKDHLVTLTYTIEVFDLDRDTDNYEALQKYLDDVKDHWDEKGYNAKVNKADTSFTATCIIEQQCDSREQAFETLYSFLTNEISVFEDVEYSYSKDFYKEDYMLSGSMDLTDIVDSSIYSRYPQHMSNSVEKVLESSSVTITLELPYNDSDTTGETTQKVFTQEVSLENETQFEAVGVIKNFENAELERQTLAEKADYEYKIKLAAIISGALLLIIIGLIVGKVIAGKKAKNQDPEEAAQKKMAKEEAKAAKKAEKEAKKAKKDAEKAETKAKKEAEKAEAEAKKEAEKAQKESEKEAKETDTENK